MLTCVSCFYKVHNKHNNLYEDWFNNTLSINCPYVFFSNKEGIEMIKKYRMDLPTYYIEYPIEEFYTYGYKHHMDTDPIHCPSVELNLIWNEKIFMIEKAYKINPFNSEWFHWIDAGICIYRPEKPPDYPFPDITKLVSLPKNKFIYSSSYELEEATIHEHYHHISGTAYLLHNDILPQIVELYKEYFNKIVHTNNKRLDKNNIWTDQVILTHIFIDHPDLFHKLCEGYGNLTRCLF
jgi:Bacterial protein of unknown function (HtrL_YibB)